jgi:hypothetical protein
MQTSFLEFLKKEIRAEISYGRKKYLLKLQLETRYFIEAKKLFPDELCRFTHPYSQAAKTLVIDRVWFEKFFIIGLWTTHSLPCWVLPNVRFSCANPSGQLKVRRRDNCFIVDRSSTSFDFVLT